MAQNFVEEYVLINGISQYFLHIPNASKDVLIMLHGGPGLANSYVAYYQQPYLDFCNVVYYDQRGAGKTQLRNQSASESLTLDTLLEDLKQTIAYVKEKYGTDRIFLLGHSWGSMLGTQYILRYPQDVMGYIGYGQVVADAVQSRSWYAWLKAAILEAGDQEDIAALHCVNDNFPDVSREEYFEAYAMLGELGLKYDFTASDVFEVYGNSPIWTAEDEAQAAGIELLNQKLYEEVLFGYDIRNVKVYQAPVYYVVGRYDEMTSSVVAAAYFETIEAPKKGLYWIEDAGHLMDTDQPGAFFGVVKGIVAGLS
ncbi:MAG: alpha/beta hydrolase [Oscillospiraceae bacterium]|nr:alpha/beta hydrolase [Oscillospiraceae bacterium]